jgi:diaminohydroxyphosphoribosylaminopyrimidine deaminase/5-amino-6-(5-phosphoribosylamino)uracil reductase
MRVFAPAMGALGSAAAVYPFCDPAKERDQRFMRRAIAQSEHGRCSTSPNPWVGAVIVAADGATVLGEGYHTKAGSPHAEVEAVRDARRCGNVDLRGATCYTTLEPCHRGPGKRTPPCDEMLVREGMEVCFVTSKQTVWLTFGFLSG